jgi:hypothetical protein
MSARQPATRSTDAVGDGVPPAPFFTSNDVAEGTDEAVGAQPRARAIEQMRTIGRADGIAANTTDP